MRIIIEFEGTEPTVKSAQTGPVAIQAPVGSAMPAGSAPAEVLAAGAAIGALDAGPAPNVAAQPPGVPPQPLPMTGPGALPAGAAPMTSLM